MGTRIAPLSQDYEPVGQLVGRLRTLGGRRRALARMRAGLWFLVLAPAGVLLIGWMDLLAALSPPLRIGALAAALLLATALALRAPFVARSGARPRAVARDVDRLAGSGGQVTVGLDLTRPGAGLPALTLALARIAVRRANEIAWGVSEDQIEPVRSLARPIQCFVGFLVVALALGLACPRALRTERLRLFDPWGDHPPYSRHTFEVDPGDTEVVYGDSVTLLARVAGAPVEQLDLVVRQADAAEEALPMFQESDGSWRGQLTDVTAPLTYWVRAGRARSHRFRASVIFTPRIESLTVRVTPPAYTNRPAVEGPLPQGGIAGLPGSEVRIAVQSNRPLSRGELRISPEAGDPRTLVAQPAADAPTGVAWQFVLREAGSLRLRVVDVQGERSAAEISAPLVLLEDRQPFVRIAQPMAESFSTPDIVMPVVVEAEDDYGVSSLQLYRSLNGSRHLPTPLMVPLPAEERVRAGDVLPLPEFALSAGDVISLFARAEDTNPAGPRGSESGIVRITIISRETYEELLRAQKARDDFERKYAAAARRLEARVAEGEQLAQDAEAEQGEAVSNEMQERLGALADALAEAAAQTRQAAEQEPLYDLDSPLADALNELASALDEATEAARGAAGAGSPAEMRKALAGALSALGAGEQAYQQSVTEPLDRFMRAYALLEMAERFVRLYERQRELAERMSGLVGEDGEPDPALRVRMRDLQEEQNALRAELAAVLEGIRAGAEELPEGPEFEKLRRTALAFVDAVDASRAAAVMAEGAEALGANLGTAAHARATEAADELEKFIKKCAAAAGAAAQRCELAFQPSMQEAAAATAAQLLRSANLGSAGLGAGGSGYSVRTNTLANVGLYGPQTTARSAGRGQDASTSGGFLDQAGGSMAYDIGARRAGLGGRDGLPLRSVPSQHRRPVQDYFRRVAEEASAGTVLRPTPRAAGPEGPSPRRPQ